MYEKLYGQLKDKQSLQSVLDEVRGDLRKVRKLISAEDRKLLEDHEALVRQMEKEIAEAERRYIAAALEKSDGVRTRASELLHISYRSFRHYAKKHNL